MAEVAPVPVTAVVGTWAPQPDDVRLVAYLETDQADAIEAAALREALKARLPDYMVPQHVVTLDRFPQTANGKIDRKRLPEPEGVGGDREIVPPRNEAERRLFAIWGDVLGDANVSRTDNFFERGGHSLLAMMLVGRIEKEIGQRIALRTVLTGSLGDIADTLAGTAGAQAPAPDAARIPVVDRAAGEIEIAPSQVPLWIVHKTTGDTAADHIWSGWDITGDLDRAALQRALDAVVDRHESLRMAFAGKGATAVLVPAATASVDIEFVSLEEISREQRLAESEQRMSAFFSRPFDFAKGRCCAPSSSSSSRRITACSSPCITLPPTEVRLASSTRNWATTTPPSRQPEALRSCRRSRSISWISPPGNASGASRSPSSPRLPSISAPTTS